MPPAAHWPSRRDREASRRACRRGRRRTAGSLAVLGERRRRLPHLHAGDRKTFFRGVLENEPGDVFRGGIALADEYRLAEVLQDLHERIVMTQQHLVIERLIDPALDDPLDIAEVADHVAAVEPAVADFD